MRVVFIQHIVLVSCALLTRFVTEVNGEVSSSLRPVPTSRRLEHILNSQPEKTLNYTC